MFLQGGLKVWRIQSPLQAMSEALIEDAIRESQLQMSVQFILGRTGKSRCVIRWPENYYSSERFRGLYYKGKAAMVMLSPFGRA